MTGSGTEARTPVRGCFEVVEQIPLCRRFMWSLEVAMIGDRYLATAFLVRCGAPRRNPWWMTMSRNNLGGLYISHCDSCGMMV